MKKAIVSILFIGLTIGCFSQSAEISARILQKMTDSLLLTTTEARNVDSVNQLLQLQKMQARQQYSHPDSLTQYIQSVERSRDSLYRIILPEPKYFQYRQKKRNLISNN